MSSSASGATIKGSTKSRYKETKNAKMQVIKAARMPGLPREEFKIGLRPQGGLNVAKVGSPAASAAILAAANISSNDSMGYTICPNVQKNTVVVSTPKDANAIRYAAIKTIVVQGNRHDVNACETAPYDSTKGVVRGIPIEDSPMDIENNIVNPRNPLALGAKRIGTTTTLTTTLTTRLHF